MYIERGRGGAVPDEQGPPARDPTFDAKAPNEAGLVSGRPLVTAHALSPAPFFSRSVCCETMQQESRSCTRLAWCQ